MAIPKIAALVLVVLCFIFIHEMEMENGSSLMVQAAEKIDCMPKCEFRCSTAGEKQKKCLRACNTCCERCNCVPPGTAGSNEETCPCYATMTTHGDRHKCP